MSNAYKDDPLIARASSEEPVRHETGGGAATGPVRSRARTVEGVVPRAVFLSPGQGETLWVMGTFIVFKLRGGDAGATVFEETAPPRTGGAVHLHHAQDESLYVLDGIYEIIVDGRRTVATSGCFVHIPRGAIHSIRTIGATAGRTLVSVTPGRLMHFFDEVGVPVADRASFQAPGGLPDRARILASAKRNELEFLSLGPL